jgi:ATPase subunit of ABC transporter with duplicated ATPase domains
VDKDILGEAFPAAGLRVGYLPQEPQLDPAKDVRANVEDGVSETRALLTRFEDVSAKLGEPLESDEMEKLLDEQARLQDRIDASNAWDLDRTVEMAMDALRVPPGDMDVAKISGGERRRVALCRLLLSRPDMLLLDEPTNHLDADSITWLRDFLRGHRGGLVVISHDVGLLDATMNRVFHLDANRAALDVYNVGWKAYGEQRENDERRRKRERANAEKKAGALMAQADRMRYKATLAKTALSMEKRAERLLAGVAEVRRADRVARLRFPDPAPAGRVVLTARGLSKGFGSTEVFTGVDLEVERASRTVVLGVNGAGKTTLLRVLAGLEQPEAGLVIAGHGMKLGYYAQEHETLRADRTVLANMRAAAPDADLPVVRGILGSFLFSGDTVEQEVRTLSGGEKTRLALAALVVSGANLLLLDEPTNNLDPASREEVLSALSGYRGAVLLVTHDEGAVQALRPQRVVLMPEGITDWWDASLSELVSLA